MRSRNQVLNKKKMAHQIPNAITECFTIIISTLPTKPKVFNTITCS